MSTPGPPADEFIGPRPPSMTSSPPCPSIWSSSSPPTISSGQPRPVMKSVPGPPINRFGPASPSIPLSNDEASTSSLPENGCSPPPDPRNVDRVLGSNVEVCKTIVHRQLQGGTEVDVLTGRPGADVLAGGDDSDVASYAGAPVGVTVNLTAGIASGGAGSDTLR